MDNTESSLIPAAYDGREQALIKHRLLEDYLEKLFLIIGMGTRSGSNAELCYVDCFAGPWGDCSEDMKSTSIAISLNTLDTCRQKLASLRVFVNIKALYIERNPASFKRLEGYLADHTPHGIRSQCMQGDFVVLRQEILNWVGPDAFTFFFIDPKGYTPIAVPILAPLIRRPRSEFLINLMYDHANRAMSMQGMKPTMANVLGKDLDVTDMSPLQREHAFVHTYRESLKQCVPTSKSRPARAAHARIMNPARARAKYHLVYLTTHPLGIVKFMEISEGTDRVQSLVRAEKRNKKKSADTGMDLLFSAEEMAESDVMHAAASEVDRFWCQYLSDGDRLIDTAAFADILENTDWFEGDLQASLVRLVKAGKVVNRSANAARRHKRPLHHERTGETLGWVAI